MCSGLHQDLTVQQHSSFLFVHHTTGGLQTTEQQQEGNTLHQRHGIKTSQFPLLLDICHLLCDEQIKNSNVVVRLNLGANHYTFNSSSLYILYTESKI
jgi:hypothetical protein